MTKEEAIINHRHMWNWLGNNPKADKKDYLLTYSTKPYPYQKCFLCEYHRTHPSHCAENCILKWPEDSCITELFGEWTGEPNFTLKAKLARQIRDLPEREEKVMEYPVINTLGACSTAIEPPKLTREEAIARTREQWKWLARTPLCYRYTNLSSSRKRGIANAKTM